MYGTISSTKIGICYLKNVANDDLVAEVKYRINNLSVDYIVSSGQLEHLIEDDNYSFPQIISTERPDRVASYILEGRVAILVNRNSLCIGCTSCTYRLSNYCWGQEYKISIFKFIKDN